MQIQLLIPSENQKKVPIIVSKEETVASFRNKVASEVKVSKNDFLLIVFGKIMMDTKANKEAATLFSTYRVRHQTCVFVHINVQNKTPCQTENRIKHRTTIKQTTRIRSSSSITISTPFGDYNCNQCQNNTSVIKCLECGCAKCHFKTGDPLICDQCDNYWHLRCANLRRIPTGQYWYCPDCINLDDKLIVGKNERVSEEKHRKRIIVIRDMDCILVPPQHSGKIPGIYCGQFWACRALLHDWGIHRASRASVAGSSYTGAVSLVLSWGLKEDRDEGYQFVYSGSGGQLRTKSYVNSAQMTEDQRLTKVNKALAITCYAPFNPEVGNKSLQWRKSRPIRVCRAAKRVDSHPEFAPLQGIRYDGLYKVVRYWPHKDTKSGFIIWKFLLRRDDQESPPWMAQCKQLITKRGLRIIESEENMTQKLVRYNIPCHIQRLIKRDAKNKRLWDEIKKVEFWSEYEFLHYLFDTAVTCSSNVCSKPIKDPVTTPCGHICCVNCLIKSKTEHCFTCRSALPKDPLEVNHKLVRILQSLNWGYGIEHIEPLPINFSKDELLMKEEQDVEFEIKQEFEFPTISEALAAPDVNIKPTPKKARVVIEYLGNESSVGRNKKHKSY
ncbi:PUA-like domain-containing protein [Helicostylum pulchrum]|nr:PUA-like domain-containing protein [Helicostylum pulchrum]